MPASSAGPSSAAAGVKGRKGASSPTALPLSPAPKLRLNLRPSSSSSTSTSKRSPNPSSAHTTPRPRKTASDQRVPRTMSSSDSEDDGNGSDSSELTPADEDYKNDHDDDDDVDMDIEAPAPKSAGRGRKTPTHPSKSTPKSSAVKAGAGAQVKATATSSAKGKGKPKAGASATPTKSGAGPAGREKKRQIKLGQTAKQRARDAKMDGGFTAGGADATAANDDEDAGSFGDDESEVERFETDVGFGYGYQDEDDVLRHGQGLPDEFAGQEIEDLQYGAGDVDFMGNVMSGMWSDEEDHYIDHLSGSEAERMSQSSVGISDQELPASDSDFFSSSSEDELDEFGFPVIPSFSGPPLPLEEPKPTADGQEDNGLLLMEDWTGALVLVQPRADRSRSRARRSQRGSGSRTEGSVGGSTVFSSAEQQLIIDPDANDHEFSDSSYWTGLSDEESDCGDTTDSMDEDEMPIIDSPAMAEIMESRAVPLPSNIPMLPAAQAAGPSIIVTDADSIPQTPALSVAASTPALGSAGITQPQTPGGPVNIIAVPSSTPGTTTGPVMGRFYPLNNDPAHFAVVGNSETPAKSPFTHGRRPRRHSNETTSTAATGSVIARKRRQENGDVFSPVPPSSKKKRYTSIPGHPRYIRAQRAEAALAVGQDREATPSDPDLSALFSLEDMLETSALAHEHHEQHLPTRFDRIQVSHYLKRNVFGGPTPGGHEGSWSSPVRGGSRMRDTLVGPIGTGPGRWLESPVLAPVAEGISPEARSRKDKRRMKRQRERDMAPLQI